MTDATSSLPKISAADEVERSYRILAFAPERVGLTLEATKKSLKRRNYELFFEPFSSHVRFDEFDAVIYFQGIFEKFELKTGFNGNGTYLSPMTLKSRV